MYIVRRLEIDDGSEPRMVQERPRGVALRENRYHDPGVYEPRGKPRSSEEEHLQERWCANHPVETKPGAGGEGIVMQVLCISSLLTAAPCFEKKERVFPS